MTFLTRHFDPLTQLAPKFPNSAVQILLFRMKHTVAIVTHAHVLQNFYTTWVRGVACQKQRLGPKLEGSWAKGTSKNLGPLHILHNLGLGLDYQKATFKTKNGGRLDQGSIQKNWDLLRIPSGFGTILPKYDV